jgi:hypothetical protein
MGHVSLMFMSEWHEYPSAPFSVENKQFHDNSRLHIVKILRVA